MVEHRTNGSNTSFGLGSFLISKEEKKSFEKFLTIRTSYYSFKAITTAYFWYSDLILTEELAGRSLTFKS